MVTRRYLFFWGGYYVSCASVSLRIVSFCEIVEQTTITEQEYWSNKHQTNFQPFILIPNSEFRIPKSPVLSIFFLRLSCCDFLFVQTKRKMKIITINNAIVNVAVPSKYFFNEQFSDVYLKRAQCIAHIANSKRWTTNDDGRIIINNQQS